MKRKKRTIHLSPGSMGYANNPVLFYRYGYLWIGKDAPGDQRCFAILDAHKAVRMAKAILSRAALKS